MVEPLLVIKFGGSIISYKDQMPPKAQIKVIQMLVGQLKEISKKYTIILIHGAGSFAHQYSYEYKLPNGIQSELQVTGFSIADSSLLSLHTLIVNEMVVQELPAIGLPPHAFIQKIDKKLKTIPLDGIKQFLKNKQIPVMYGDVVLDEVQGCSILSGDEIAGYLAHHLCAEKVIFASDVNGIYTDNPKTNSDAKHIPLITNENIEDVISRFVQHNKKDVSGEMKMKLLQIREAMPNIPTYILNGLLADNLISVIEGKQVGTKVLLK